MSWLASYCVYCSLSVLLDLSLCSAGGQGAPCSVAATNQGDGAQLRALQDAQPPTTVPYPQPLVAQSCLVSDVGIDAITTCSCTEVLKEAALSEGMHKARGISMPTVPLGPRFLNEFFGKHAAFGSDACCYSAASNKFKAAVNELQVSCDGEFPKQVIYERHCRSLCRGSTPLSALSLQAQAIAVLALVAKSLAKKGKHANIALSDVVLVVEACVAGEEACQKRAFVHLTHSMGQYGRFPASVEFSMLQVSRGFEQVAF